MKKTLYGIEWNIAQCLGIDRTVVNRVLSAYTDFCIEEVKSGKRLTLGSIAYIVPKRELISYKSTLSYICDVVARNNGFTYNTVLSIVNKYYDILLEDILSGNSVTIKSLVNIHPLKEEGVVTRIHSSASQRLKNEVESSGNPIRVHTHMYLRRQIKGGVNE